MALSLPPPRSAGNRQLGPRDRQEQHRCLLRPVGHVLDEVEEGRLGPVQVVQHDDERALTRDPLEERPGSPGDLLGDARAFTGDPFVQLVGFPSSSRRRTSISGQYVMPSPYGRQRPSRIVASPSARSRNSRTRRDLPIPAVPRMVNRYGVRSRTARSNACQSWESSFSRPTIGASSRRVNGSRRRPPEQATCRDGLLALGRDGRDGPARTASRTRPNVESLEQDLLGAAACSSRAAVLTASPTAIVCPSPVTTSPVFTPVRASIRRPNPLELVVEPASASRISAAARTARAALRPASGFRRRQRQRRRCTSRRFRPPPLDRSAIAS